ncbi:MAG TPA: PLP-dependent aspartate aminotransferase family protein [Candidatus Thermoplasmatota archaeon]|nr:PLP-dependent aspartate aminotransferase family protein [Candidatus Thermoplasmatota archaeon]
MAKRARGLTTIAVHAGERYDPSTGAVGTPIYQNSTFYYPRKPDGRGGWVPNEDFIYSRYSNPTVQAAEEKFAALEGAESAICFASGMAAVSASNLAFVKAGETVVAQANMYGGTIGLFNREFQRLGIGVKYSWTGAAEDLASLVDASTRIVYVEAPSNPFNHIVDLPKLRQLLDRKWGRKRPRILIDATTASPYNFRPLEHGADISIHSATKYLNGHSDIIAGAVAGSNSLMEEIRPWLKSFGGCMDPHQAFLLRRGMATLALRMRRHNENGVAMARMLARHRAVETVWHPSLSDHPSHGLGRRLMKGFGSIVTFQLKTRRAAAARRFFGRLELFAIAASLGGVESLASLPLETQYRLTPPTMRKRLGVTPTLIRLALGIEDTDDLLADVTQALRAV